jgi:hypothetical protein
MDSRGRNLLNAHILGTELVTIKKLNLKPWAWAVSFALFSVAVGANATSSEPKKSAKKSAAKSQAAKTQPKVSAPVAHKLQFGKSLEQARLEDERALLDRQLDAESDELSITQGAPSRAVVTDELREELADKRSSEIPGAPVDEEPMTEIELKVQNVFRAKPDQAAALPPPPAPGRSR